ncbi:MAG: sigma-70 family RNA polymerase sigma factor [Oscillospiraceae bacterium]|nr:sigma-70 family RNA polymerase sigma factor [Oscillospiraceae bacterium]
MKDEKIIGLYWQRDESAIAESEKKYGAYCFAVAENILHDREDSEEALSDTWMRSWNSIPPKKPQNLKLFFAKITRNLAFDRFKVKTAEKRGGGETALIIGELGECVPSAFCVEEEIAGKELRESINSFVKGLSLRERNVFIRRYFFAEKIGDIAKRYGISENNVSVILSRTRKKLKTHLEREGDFL